MAEVPGWPPRWLTEVPLADQMRGDGELYANFAEAVCRVTKDPKTGDFEVHNKKIINHLVCGWETDTDCVCQLLRGHFLKHMSDGVLFASLVFVDASLAWRCGDRFRWFTQQFRCVLRMDHVVVAQFPNSHVR